MSSDLNGRGRGASGSMAEDPVDVGRYLEALRRSRGLIVAIVAIVTGAVLAVSLTLPKRYEATANIVVNNPNSFVGSTEAGAVQRNLATTATLATTAAVLAEAARSVAGETRSALAKRVSASVNENANIIDIKVTYPTAKGAAELAYAVARAFLNQHAAIQRSNTAGTLSVLNDEIASLRARSVTEPSVTAQLTALQARAAELEAGSASSGSQLQLVERPAVPSAPSSPRPFRNGVIALFASLFLAVLVALAREQLTPRVTSQRELSHLLSLPVLAGIPSIRRRVDVLYARAEYEAYQTLSAAVRLALPPSPEPHIVLVTSATHGEGKTTVTARLGRVLAQAGHRTLVVSGDLRWPKLDEAFNVNGSPGLRELLSREAADSGVRLHDVDKLILPAQGDGARPRGELDILPAGRREGDASELLHTPALPALLGALRQSPYAYVLIDSAPILGVADAQMFAQFCDELLVVARLDHLKVSDVIDLREILDRMECTATGLVVIGTRLSVSPYYAAEAPIGEGAPARIVG
jgi:Mrp family chromosome partitioning ATPase/capsular polysaccharide biosynthesis protein